MRKERKFKKISTDREKKMAKKQGHLHGTHVVYLRIGSTSPRVNRRLIDALSALVRFLSILFIQIYVTSKTFIPFIY